jgi:hypothetical protein
MGGGHAPLVLSFSKRINDKGRDADSLRKSRPSGGGLMGLRGQRGQRVGLLRWRKEREYPSQKLEFAY